MGAAAWSPKAGRGLGLYSQDHGNPRQMCEQGRSTVSRDSSRVSLGSGGGEPGDKTTVPEGEAGPSQTRMIMTKVGLRGEWAGGLGEGLGLTGVQASGRLGSIPF